MLFYSYADLTVASTFPLRELSAIQNNPKESFPDFTLYLLDSTPEEPDQTDWIRHWRNDDEYITLSLARKGDGFLLRFPFLADFIIDAEGSRIGVWAAPDTDEATLRHLLLDQVLPRVLGYKERLVLHASAVLVNGKAMAFAGNTGAGKSTLAANFQTAGYQVLTDDGLIVTAGESCSFALPVYPGLRLWPQSVAALFEEPVPDAKVALFEEPVPDAKVSCYSEKQRIQLPRQVGPSSAKLSVLYILSSVNSDDAAGGIGVKRLSPRDACIELIRYSFQLDVSNIRHSAVLMALASAITQQLPVFTLAYPHDFSILPAVHEAILEQQNNLMIASG
jgi:hypothetical protein